MTHELQIAPADPYSPAARQMAAALWSEIQHRYGFTAPDPFKPEAFTAPRGGFWLATQGGPPVGSVALSPLDDKRAELDVMYVAESHRRAGVARALLTTAEDHARATGSTHILLRCGEPQPEAMDFYRSAGYLPIDRFGVWIDDETARCLAREIS